VNLPNAGWILNRRVFDQDLGQMAKDSGVTLLTGASATGLVTEGGRPVGVEAEIEGKERRYFAPIIIAADGISSMVGRWAGLDTGLGLSDVTSCSQAFIRSENICEGTVEFVVSADVAPGGYAWVFPKGEGTANVGVGICPTHSTRKASDFLSSFVKRRFKNPRVLDLKAGGVPSIFKGEIARENVLLCGDAARACHPLTGGGIYNAVATGSLAGNVVAEGKRNRIARRYTVRTMRKLGRELKLGEELRKIYLELGQPELEELWEFGSRRFSGKTISVLHPFRIMGLFFCAHPRYLKYVPRLARAGLQMSNMI
jgi:digeranylgeranylglycerophospholipid reductase